MKYFEKVANYEDAIMEKIATRAWKKNYGNLSYENKQKLLNTGVHSYDREHAGLKRGNDALIKKYNIDVRQGLRGKLKTLAEVPKMVNTNLEKLKDSRFVKYNSIPADAVETFKSLSPRQSRLAKIPMNIVISKQILTNPAFGMAKKDTITGVAEKNIIIKDRDPVKSLAKLGKRGEVRFKDHTKNKKSHDWVNDMILRHEIDELRAGHRKKSVAHNFGHADPSVIMRESENVKYAPRDVRKTMGQMRQQGEAPYYGDNGFRYGKSRYTGKDAKRIRNGIFTNSRA